MERADPDAEAEKGGTRQTPAFTSGSGMCGLQGGGGGSIVLLATHNPEEPCRECGCCTHWNQD